MPIVVSVASFLCALHMQRIVQWHGVRLSVSGPPVRLLTLVSLIIVLAVIAQCKSPLHYCTINIALFIRRCWPNSNQAFYRGAKYTLDRKVLRFRNISKTICDTDTIVVYRIVSQ